MKIVLTIPDDFAAEDGDILDTVCAALQEAEIPASIDIFKPIEGQQYIKQFVEVGHEMMKRYDAKELTPYSHEGITGYWARLKKITDLAEEFLKKLPAADAPESLDIRLQKSFMKDFEEFGKTFVERFNRPGYPYGLSMQVTRFEEILNSAREILSRIEKAGTYLRAAESRPYCKEVHGLLEDILSEFGHKEQILLSTDRIREMKYILEGALKMPTDVRNRFDALDNVYSELANFIQGFGKTINSPSERLEEILDIIEPYVKGPFNPISVNWDILSAAEWFAKSWNERASEEEHLEAYRALQAAIKRVTNNKFLLASIAFSRKWNNRASEEEMLEAYKTLISEVENVKKARR